MNNLLFVENRKRLFNKLPDRSVVCLYSGNFKHKSGDESYPFSVNKNFYYLTGLDKPNIYLVMTKSDSREVSKIYTPSYKESDWITPGYKAQEIINISHVDEVEYYDEIAIALDRKCVLYIDFQNADFDLDLPRKTRDCYDMITRLRAIKSPQEIEKLRHSIAITHEGLKKVYDRLDSCEYEYQAQALFEGGVKYCGAKDLSFDTIVASGKNACTLHYSDNNSRLHKGDFVLFDLGAKSTYYSADISRTLVYRGEMSPLQKRLYNMVLNAQKLAISMVKPGTTINEINNAVINYYFEKLPKIDKTLIHAKEDVKEYYMHNIGHSLGLDTHDDGLYRDEPLVPGNVITIEPGIYIKKYGIGIRIEDDVLVTNRGREVLSKDIPK